MRKDYGKNNPCPYCGEYFNYLGIASHRARCREKSNIMFNGQKFALIDINYNLEKIAHRLSYQTIQSKDFNREAYKNRIETIVVMHMKGYNYREIGDKVNRSPERIRQILSKFYRILKWMENKDLEIS